ncbi:MAG: alpha/beta hydrolase [Alphaproteobacteria bacterium]|nr:alpha/beta hydrolase [Alphaproteobacteria bacterium]MDE2011592.1 alpha/beta hydrolase [Alphaproteobacteria bacterium]MDE2071938.1 alpha/beta hydrolase [Alphaproteobacteria bacterium]MDE2353060.1 alpha/beta hydrolase [Alphaproteobacteria bacterium]
MPQLNANGLAFEYESFGRESDPAILLIMGFSAQMTMWPTALCEGLAGKGFRVVRFDNRDVGKSSHLSHLGAPDIPGVMAKLASGASAAVPYTLADMAADAVGVLKALDIGSAHVVGASMGGMIAQIVAAQYPAAARSLVSIMSTSGRRDLPQAAPEVLAALTTPPASDSREDRIAAGMKVWQVIGSPGYRESEADLRAIVAREVDRAPYDPDGISRQMLAIWTALPRNDLLKTITAPTLVLHGAEDPLLPPACGEDTAASIPGSKLVMVPGMGHGFESGLVPVYLKHIGDFVAGVEAALGR